MSTAPQPAPPRSRPWWPWLALGLGATLILAGAAGFLALSSGGGVFGQSATTNRTFTEQVSRVEVRGGSGTIDIRAGGTPGRVEVTREAHWGPFNAQPAPEESVDAQTLRLAAGCSGFLSWCSIDYILSVPDGTAVSIDQGSGAVTLTGRLGTTDAKTGSGTITARGIADSLRLETGSGSITASDLQSSQVTAHTGSGSITLDLARAASSLAAETGSGSITLRVPQGSYAVDVDTGSGSRQVDVASDPKAPNRIQAKTGSGSVSVHYR